MIHKFGGHWTRVKLEILKEYLIFYSSALKGQPFTLHYADAFAGTGSIQPHKTSEEQLFPLEDLKGSVLTALETEPGFRHYHFNDINPDHIDALHEIKDNHPHKHISITKLDANEFVTQFCTSLRGKSRAVLFADPYNTEFKWSTLEIIARSKKIDLWLLFPISALLRMTPKDGEKVRPEWEPKINGLLGTDKWMEALYKPVEKTDQPDLFSQQDEDDSTERVNPYELQAYVKSRLEEIFSFVAKPVLLKTNRGSPLFSFFFAVSNPQKAAWELAQKAASHIIKKHG